MNKTIKMLDEYNQLHGYQEWYSHSPTDSIILFRCNAQHGKFIGYEEDHMFNFTKYHIR